MKIVMPWVKRAVPRKPTRREELIFSGARKPVTLRHDRFVCSHPSVSMDPILKQYFCPTCLVPLPRVPDVLISPPCTMNLWQRIRWAFGQRTKVPVIEFVWTVRWATSRQGMQKTVLPYLDPKDQTQWYIDKPPMKPLTDEQRAKMYDHLGSQNRPKP